MKRIYKVTLFILMGVIFFSSCKDELDQKPQDAMQDEDAITDIQLLRSATIGIYNGVRSLEWYGRTYPTMLELRGSNMYIAARNSNRYRTSYQYNYTLSDVDVTDVWNRIYNVIARANNVINRVNDVTDGTVDEKNQLVAEAKFIRALAYFDLTRVFGKTYSADNGASLSVPLVLDKSNPTPKRETVKVIYDQIIKDLIEAKADLPEDTNTKFRATSYAASALLARVYLYKGDAVSNDLAIQEATRVIDAGYELTPPNSYRYDVFWATPGQSEEIFTAKITQFQDLGSDNYGQLYVKELGGYGDFFVRPSFYDSYDNADVRKTGVMKEDEVAEALITTKFYMQDNIPGMYSPKILRLAEMYFIRAEANFKQGTTLGASPQADLSAVRAQRGLPAYTGAVTLAEILKEKNFEFAFEGHQWQDNLRNGIVTARPNITGAISNNDTENLAVNDNKQLFPIPQRELDANPNIKPNNPGYNN